MKKAKKTNRSENEASEWDESKSVRVVPEKPKFSVVLTSICLPKEMVTKLRKLARRKGEKKKST